MKTMERDGEKRRIHEIEDSPGLRTDGQRATENAGLVTRKEDGKAFNKRREIGEEFTFRQR